MTRQLRNNSKDRSLRMENRLSFLKWHWSLLNTVIPLIQLWKYPHLEGCTTLSCYCSFSFKYKIHKRQCGFVMMLRKNKQCNSDISGNDAIATAYLCNTVKAAAVAVEPVSVLSSLIISVSPVCTAYTSLKPGFCSFELLVIRLPNVLQCICLQIHTYCINTYYIDWKKVNGLLGNLPSHNTNIFSQWADQCFVSRWLIKLSFEGILKQSSEEVAGIWRVLRDSHTWGFRWRNVLFASKVPSDLYLKLTPTLVWHL